MIKTFEDMLAALPTQFHVDPYYIQITGAYLCDTVEDLRSLPLECSLGSTARVISPPSIYAKLSTGEWVLQAPREEG